ncbi:Ldh family oxidoreductase [Streptomyces sp. NPDC006335]|uniref:Ldh family oxidoreductase n=1 Tax=Streptomyces sp. NPDC006335 TaxID=3156895 RepID=UPI0033AD1A31
MMKSDGWWSTDSDTIVRVDAESAQHAAVNMLRGLGVPEGDAQCTARHLVEGDLRGYPMHGLQRLLQMDEMIRRGTLEPAASRRRTRKTDATAVVDGAHGLGPPAASMAIALARELAESTGLGLVGVHNAGHLGTLGPWAEQAAGEDSFALVMSASEPGVVLPGGGDPVFGTNPIAYCWPTGEGHLTADFSTAAVTRSELLRRAEQGHALPPGTAVGPDGEPTRDPHVALKGGLLPLGGGHKGMLISLLAAFLAGPVMGGPPAHSVKGTRRSENPPEKTDVFLVMRLDAATSRKQFLKDMERFLGHARAAGPFRMPGEQARAHRAQALSGGIELSGQVARLLWPERVAVG